MVEQRAVKYGRFLGQLTNYLINSLSNGREEYRQQVIVELEKYSFKKKKKGEPANEGFVRELKNIDKLDLNNPKHFARFIKEGLHLMYQKETSKKVLEVLLKNL